MNALDLLTLKIRTPDGKSLGLVVIPAFLREAVKVQIVYSDGWTEMNLEETRINLPKDLLQWHKHKPKH